MPPFSTKLVALLLAIAVAGPVAAKTIAKIDGVEVTDEDLAVAAEDIGGQLPAMDEAQKRQYLIDYLVDLKIVAKAAEKEKLAEGPDFQRRLTLAREKLLMERLLTTIGDKATDEKAMRDFYTETLKTLKPEQEVHARHILVETEDQAKAALERVKKGEDFAKVAGELSKDPGSGKDGGDLGYFTKDRMVKEFGEAAFKLKPGEVSEIVKTQFGYHIIKSEDLRDRPAPPFEQVKDQIKRYLMQKAQQDAILKMRESVKVERLDAPAAPKPAEAPKP